MSSFLPRIASGTPGKLIVSVRTFHEQDNACKLPEPNSDPKFDPKAPTKDPDEWVSGDPMTPSQASYLKTLCEQAGDADAFDQSLTKAEASKRIDELKQDLGLE